MRGQKRSGENRLLPSPLLKVFLDPLRLAQQIRGVLVGRLDVLGDDLHVLVEVLDEFLVLLVSPRRAQGVQLCAQRRQPLLEFLVELLEVVGETTQFDGVDDGLRHRARNRNGHDARSAYFHYSCREKMRKACAYRELRQQAAGVDSVAKLPARAILPQSTLGDVSQQVAAQSASEMPPTCRNDSSRH